MLKALWTALSILLLLNILIVLGFVVWLRTSGRLDGQRIDRIRQMLAVTVEQEKAQEEQAKALEEEAKQKAMQLALLESVSDGPISLSDRLAAQQEQDEIALLRLDRLHQDIEDLQAQLELTKRQLNKSQAELDAKRKSFEEAVQRQVALETDENFQQAVSMYEKLKPKQAKQMFQTLLDQGQLTQVVDYLAAMQLRKAAAVLKEFKTPIEISQATDLLQRLRERGIDPNELGI